MLTSFTKNKNSHKKQDHAFGYRLSIWVEQINNRDPHAQKQHLGEDRRQLQGFRQERTSEKRSVYRLKVAVIGHAGLHIYRTDVGCAA